jgi:hypothetical protein
MGTEEEPTPTPTPTPTPVISSAKAFLELKAIDKKVRRLQARRRDIELDLVTAEAQQRIAHLAYVEATAAGR